MDAIRPTSGHGPAFPLWRLLDAVLFCLQVHYRNIEQSGGENMAGLIPHARFGTHVVRTIGPLVFVLSLNLALLSLLSARGSPLQIFEPDFYGSASMATWIMVATAMLIPVMGYVFAVKFEFASASIVRWFLAAFVVSFVGSLLIPWSRYPAGFDRWDSWYHLAETNVVIITGHTSVANFYPATHL